MENVENSAPAEHKQEGAPKARSDALFVKSKIHDYVHSKGCNVAGDVLDGDPLNNAIKELLDKAIKRAQDNGRKTLQSKDL